MGSEELEYDEFQPMWDEVKETLGDKKVVLFGSYSWAEGEWMDNWKADADEAGVNYGKNNDVYSFLLCQSHKAATRCCPKTPWCARSWDGRRPRSAYPLPR